MARTTTKREEILDYLRQFTQANGYAPSVREICAAVGLQSTATVHYHLNALRDAGLINMDEMKKRTISLPGNRRCGRIPVVGVVTAGLPILAVENIEGYIPWDGQANCFALRVRGDSMATRSLSGRRAQRRTARSSSRCWTIPPRSSAFRKRAARSGCCRRIPPMNRLTAHTPALSVKLRPSFENIK